MNLASNPHPRGTLAWAAYERRLNRIREAEREEWGYIMLEYIERGGRLFVARQSAVAEDALNLESRKAGALEANGAE